MDTDVISGRVIDMDKFEETVVNPNISLNNFEVKVRDQESYSTKNNEVLAETTTRNKSNKSYKPFILLAILSSVFIYQITVIL